MQRFFRLVESNEIVFECLCLNTFERNEEEYPHFNKLKFKSRHFHFSNTIQILKDHLRIFRLRS